MRKTRSGKKFPVIEMNFFSLSLILLIGGSGFAEINEPFAGYKVYRLIAETETQVDFLDQLSKEYQANDSNQVDFWSDVLRFRPTEKQQILVMVAPGRQKQFLDSMDAQFIAYQVAISDLSSAIQDESRHDQYADPVVDRRLTWTAYHRYHAGASTDLPTLVRNLNGATDVTVLGRQISRHLPVYPNAYIEAYVRGLKAKYPDLVQTLDVIGQSYEGRNMYLLKVGKERTDGAEKPAVWLESNVHAREWISSATLLYILNRMLSEYGSSPASKRMLDEIDWYVLPVVNVDGFVFSHTDVSTRLWRKTRSVNPFSPEYGVDGNRNFDHRWMAPAGDSRGAPDQIPGSLFYAGAYPFSEIETFHVREALLDRKDHIKAMLSFHSFGQLWLQPWSYAKERTEDYEELYDVGQKATDALRALSGTEFRVGTAAEVLYVAAGYMMDFARAKAGIKYSYTPELRDRGELGFILPPDQIIPTGREMFAAVEAIAEIVQEKYGLPP